MARPKRSLGEAVAFGRLVEAERTAGARTIGKAKDKVRRRDPKRWGSTRKMAGLWADFKAFKKREAAAAADMEAALASFDDVLDAFHDADWFLKDVKRRFPRMRARSATWLETKTDEFEKRAHAAIDRLELQADDPLLANWREAIKAKLARYREAVIKARPRSG